MRIVVPDIDGMGASDETAVSDVFFLGLMGRLQRWRGEVFDHAEEVVFPREGLLAPRQPGAISAENDVQSSSDRLTTFVGNPKPSRKNRLGSHFWRK